MRRQENVVKKPILALAGPTAIGKSALAMLLAQRLDGEIISCDSMQIYRGMDIGTAKPTRAERKAVMHYMIDVADPQHPYSAADYAVGAKEALATIQSKGKVPIFCGGTGLYLESVLYESAFVSPAADPALRDRLESRDFMENYEELKKIDPENAACIHPNNRKRVIRALEVYILSGKTKTQWDLENQKKHILPDTLLYVLAPKDREKLYERIDRRVDEMMAAGLLSEVRRLALSPESTAGQAIGYKELNNYLAGQISLEEAVEQIKQASRNYAKRQLTWWNRNKEARVITIERPSELPMIAEQIISDVAGV